MCPIHSRTRWRKDCWVCGFPPLRFRTPRPVDLNTRNYVWVVAYSFDRQSKKQWNCFLSLFCFHLPHLFLGEMGQWRNALQNRDKESLRKLEKLLQSPIGRVSKTFFALQDHCHNVSPPKYFERKLLSELRGTIKCNRLRSTKTSAIPY